MPLKVPNYRAVSEMFSKKPSELSSPLRGLTIMSTISELLKGR